MCQESEGYYSLMREGRADIRPNAPLAFEMLWALQTVRVIRVLKAAPEKQQMAIERG